MTRLRVAALLLALLPAGTTVARAQAVPLVPDTAAARYVGQRVTVEGPVATVKVGRHMKAIFLNFRFPYPDHSFSAWIPDSVSGLFPDVQRLERRRVRVTGVVWLQDGKWPAVTLSKPEELEVLPDPAGAR